MSLRELALRLIWLSAQKSSPFLNGKRKSHLREPSGDAWVKFREFLTPPELGRVRKLRS
jgi:hypothetical protein